MDKQTAMALIDRIGPSLGCDYTYTPLFPEGRTDVCAVNRMVENGNDDGYNVLYLVWEDNGRVCHDEVADTRSTKDYLSVDEIKVDGNEVIVEYGSGGSFSGVPWKRTFRRSIHAK